MAKQRETIGRDAGLGPEGGADTADGRRLRREEREVLDEALTQAFHSGDSEWQLDAGDPADRDPAEGADEDYDEEAWVRLPFADFNEAVEGAPEPP